MKEIYCPLAGITVEFLGNGRPLDGGAEFSKVTPCAGCAYWVEELLMGRSTFFGLSIFVQEKEVTECLQTRDNE